MNKIALFCLLHLILISFSGFSQNELKSLTSTQWIEDLDSTIQTISTKHPNPFYRISKEDFNKISEDLRAKIPNLNNEQIIVGLMKIVASMHDGHSYLIPNTSVCQTFDLKFPVRFYVFSDGLFITSIDAKHSQYLGAKVTKVGNMTVEEAIKTVSQIIGMDSETGVLNEVPNYLTNVGALKGLNIIDNPNELTIQVETKTGQREIIKFINPYNRKKQIEVDAVKFISAFPATGDSLPLYLQHRSDKYYWFSHLKNDKTIYMQFNNVVNQPDETFYDFHQRMWKYIEENEMDVEKFILDVRYNNGGNGMMLSPFIQEFIKHEKVNQPGRLFVLTGRKSFSAAIILIADMKRWTNAIFVGEPTGAPSNFYSDSRFYQLPNSLLQFGLSTKFFDLAFPADQERDFIPDIPAVFSSGDFFAGKDPALNLILSGNARLISDVAYEDGIDVAVKLYNNQIDNSKEIKWWKTPSENYLNALGYKIFETNINKAIAIFQLNTVLFPNSSDAYDCLGEAYLRAGNKELAIKNYKKSLELNPENDNAIEVLNEIENK